MLKICRKRLIQIGGDLLYQNTQFNSMSVMHNNQSTYMLRGAFFRPLLIITLTIFTCSSCSKGLGKCDATTDCTVVTFSGTIQPLAESKCAISGCHSGSFDSYSNLSSLAENGDLFQQVIETENMPDGNVSMSCEERAQFQCWIDAGAPNN